MEEKKEIFLETDYRLLFEHMTNGYAYCKAIFDELGNPEDFIYLDVSPSFEKLTGLKDVIGKKITQIFPSIKTDHQELINLYGKVATDGIPQKIELFFKPLSLWLFLSIYSPKKEFFVVFFDNITDRKKFEEELVGRNSQLEKLNKLSVTRELKMIELKSKIKELEEKLALK